MVKYVRRAVVAAALLGSACATAAPPAEPAAPPVRDEPRTVTPERQAPLRVGLVISRSGSPVLQRYAEQVLEGAQIAADQAGTATRAVELVVRDDGGTTAGAQRALRELEQQGVTVIVGPLLDETLLAAAGARSSESMLLISPTAISQPTTVRNVYALNVIDTRGATALAEYARRYGRVGVLYARSPDQTPQARAFIDAFGRGGHGSVTDGGFDPGTTNVTAQLARMRQARVEAIFFPANERQLQLVLPQIEFHGLSDVQLLGTESWLSDALRGSPQRMLEGAIVATPLLRESPDVAWRDFVSLFETRHRRSLDSAIPALGYDAVMLAVRAAGAAGSGEYRGATGILTVSAAGVTRRPFLVRIQAGRLIPVS
jgi:ABC-type branched-subunit amino acid transport system substrate-binding protein